MKKCKKCQAKLDPKEPLCTSCGEKNPTHMTKNQKIGCLIFVVFILLIILIAKSCSQQSITDDMSQDQRIAALAGNVFGHSNVISAKMSGILATVKYKEHTTLSSSAARFKIFKKSAEFARGMANNPLFKEVDGMMIMPFVKSVDELGNAGEAQAAKIVLYTNTMDKINYDNITPGDFEKIVKEHGSLLILPILR
jgi:hypothetical protein